MSKQGAEFLRRRHADYEIVASFKSKDGQDYFMTSQGNPKKPICRETLTRGVNLVFHKLAAIMDSTFTSHSCRIGYITRYWMATGDLELVRQMIGHTSIQATSHYARKLIGDSIETTIETIQEDIELKNPDKLKDFM